MNGEQLFKLAICFGVLSISDSICCIYKKSKNPYVPDFSEFVLIVLVGITLTVITKDEIYSIFLFGCILSFIFEAYRGKGIVLIIKNYVKKCINHILKVCRYLKLFF